jgi:hypothetical protein
MWIFLPDGLLMPAIVPMDLADPKFTQGKFNLQVRGRLAEHLQDFMDRYMEPGTYSEIELTPKMDYNARFYTTHEAFADGMRLAILDITYEKFKPTAKTKQYHSVLNSIWGTLTRLAPPNEYYSRRKPHGVNRGVTFADDIDTFGSLDEVDVDGYLARRTSPRRAKRDAANAKNYRRNKNSAPKEK